jgi:hypothetical protein
VSSQASAISMELVQMAAGSTLYPSIMGPIVLILAALVVAALFVAFAPGRWTPWVGLVVPLVLGLGAIVAAVVTGGFIDQLPRDRGRTGPADHPGRRRTSPANSHGGETPSDAINLMDGRAPRAS